MREFVDAASEGRTPRPGPDDGQVIMRIVNDACRAAADCRGEN